MVAEVPKVRLAVDGFEAAFPARVDGPRAVGRMRRNISFLAGVATGDVVLERRRLDGRVLAEGTAVGPVGMNSNVMHENIV